MKVDYLVVGAGLFGAVFAREAKKNGLRVAVIDKRDHIAGNIYTKSVHGINVHVYGAHIFHTSNEQVWKYINQFTKFNNYINSPVAIYKDELYNLPFNMNTFNKMWGVVTPEQAKEKIRSQVESLHIEDPKNLEEQALSLVGPDVYEKLIKGYTQKQWGRPCNELPAFIIRRLPLRFTYNNNYFNDTYQGIPIGGYTQIVEKMLDGIPVYLGVDFFDFKKEGKLPDGTEIEYKKLLFTGQIDQFFEYEFGPLQYRSVRFETEELEMENYQGNAVVNYTDADVPYTRIIEHKHFDWDSEPTTIISREYSAEWEPGVEPYYPVNDDKNSDLYSKYAAKARELPNVLFGGRLGQYKYYDMDKVIAEALELAEKEF